MANELTLKIRGDSKEVVAAVEQATRSLSKLVGVSVDTGGALEDIGRKSSGLTTAAERAGHLREGIQHLAAGLTAAAAPMVLATKLSIDFDAALRNVDSIAKLTPDALEALRGEVLALARDPSITQGPQQLAEGLYDIVSSGFEGQEALDNLRASAVAASAGMTTTAVSAKGINAVLNSHVEGVENAREASDVLFKTVDLGVVSFEELVSSIGQVLPTASQAGVSIQEIGASVAVMTRAGQSGSEATNDLLNLITKIIRPSEEAEGVFRSLGITYGVQALQGKGLTGVLQEISEKTRGNSQALNDLFPDMQAARGAISLLRNDGADLSKMLGEMGHAFDGAGATAAASAKQLQSSQAQWQKLRKELEILAIELGTKVLPELNKLLTWANEHPEMAAMAIQVAALAVAVSQLAQAGVALKGAGLIGSLGKLGPIGVGIGVAAAGVWAAKTALELKAGRPKDLGTADGLLKQDQEEAKRFPTGFAAQQLLRRQLTTAESKEAGLSPGSQEREVARLEAEALRRKLEAMRKADKALINDGRADVAGLTDPAREKLTTLAGALADLNVKGRITSAKRSPTPGIKSAHNSGEAVDIVVAGNMEQVAEALRQAGFRAIFERKGQTNANGSVATGDNIHVTLRDKAAKSSTGPGGANLPAEARSALEDARIAAIRNAEAREIAQRKQKLQTDLQELRQDVKDPAALRTGGADLRAAADREISEIQEKYRKQRAEEAKRQTAALKESADTKARATALAVAKETADLDRALAQRLRKLTAAGKSETEIALTLAEERVKGLEAIRDRDNRAPAAKKLPSALREDKIEQPLFQARQALKTLEQDQLRAKREFAQQYEDEINRGIAAVTAAYQEGLDKENAARVAAFTAAQEQAEADHVRAKALAEVNAELERQRERFVELAAAASAPAEFGAFLEAQRAALENSIGIVARGVGDEQVPEERAEGVRELIRLNAELDRIKQSILAVARETADAEADALRAVQTARNEQSQRQGEAEFRTRELETELRRRQAEQEGPDALRAFLAFEIEETEVRIRTLQGVLPVLAEDAAAGVRENLAELQLHLLDLTREMEQDLRPRWERFWRELGQDAANSLKGALANSLEDALMGNFSAKRLGEELRRVVARSLAIGITETLAAQVSRGVSRLVSGRPKSAGTPGLPGATDSDAAGSKGSGSAQAAGATAATDETDKAKGSAVKLAAVVGLAGAALGSLIGAFKGGADGLKSQIPLLIAGLVQLVLAIMVAKVQIQAGPAGAIGAVVGMIASIFSHDTPVNDSRARGLGFESVVGVGVPQVGRWGFDFQNAFGQGRQDALRGQMGSGQGQGGPGPAASAPPAPINLTVNQYNNGPINSKADVDRSYEDLGWVLQRRMRTA